MKRILIVLLTVCTFIWIFQYAAEAAEATKPSSEILSQYEQSGADKIDDEVPDDVKEIIKKNMPGLSQYDVSDALNFSGVLRFLTSAFGTALKGRLPLFAGIIITIIIGMIFKVLSTTSTGSFTHIADMVQMTAIVISVSAAVASSVSEISTGIIQMSKFCSAAAPVISTLIVSTGGAASAASASATILLASQLCSYIGTAIVLPLTNIYFAVCVCDSVISYADLSKFAGFLKKTLYILLTALIVIFSAVMSFQSLIAGASDGVLKRSVRFAVSNLIPVAGGALGDAMETVFSCAGVAKSTVGVFGLIIIALIIAAPLLRVTADYLLLKASSFAAGIMGSDRVSVLLDNISGAFGVMISLSMATSVMSIASITVAAKLFAG